MSNKTRRRIHSHVTRSRFLHVEDALKISKLRLFAGEYRRGQGASEMTAHYIDLDDARVLFADLAWGREADYAEYKGSVSEDGATSRVLKVNTADDGKVWFELTRGPGEVIGQGAVKPKGNPEVTVSVPLGHRKARKLAFAVQAYVWAWEAQYLIESKPVVPRLLAYADDTPVSDNQQEREAFRVYVSVHGDVPESRRALRAWWQERNNG